ncbi:MAG: hypothetical protein ACNA71_06860 [Kiritimatiellia bacterium]
MVDINISCPHCGELAKAPSKYAGKSADCPSCGKELLIQETYRPSAQGAVPQLNANPRITTVVVTDIKIPFVSMIILMVKWAIASIPAFIILALIGFIVSAIIAGGCGALILGSR